MSITFPSSPSLNQVATVNGRQWIWNGTAWKIYGAAYAAIAASGSASDLITGTVPINRLPLATASSFGAVQTSTGIVNSSGVISVTPVSVGAAPSTHKSQHATAGSDPLSYLDIGAQKAIVVSSSAPSGGSSGDIQLQLASASQITPTTLTTSQNNYNPSAAEIYRISATLAVNITGWTAWFDGSVRRIVNVGSFAITFPHQNSGSDENNRFITTTAGSFVLAAGGVATMYWDTTDSRIRIF